MTYDQRNTRKVDYIHKLNGKDYIVGVDLANENKKDETLEVEYHMNFPSFLSKLLQNED